MYPNITPDLRIETTISNPNDPAEILGFVGRNKKLGRTAIVLKQPAVVNDGTEVAIPPNEEKLLDQEDAEVVLLGQETVKAMSGPDFALEGDFTPVEGGGQGSEMKTVNINNELWRDFSRSAVTVGN